MKSHYPDWSIRMDLESILGKMIEMEEAKAR
jgi:hypothetical protein